MTTNRTKTLKHGMHVANGLIIDIENAIIEGEMRDAAFDLRDLANDYRTLAVQAEELADSLELATVQ